MTKERFNRLEANHKYILDLLEVQGYLVICLGNHERKIFNSNNGQSSSGGIAVMISNINLEEGISRGQRKFVSRMRGNHRSL